VYPQTARSSIALASSAVPKATAARFLGADLWADAPALPQQRFKIIANHFGVGRGRYAHAPWAATRLALGFVFGRIYQIRRDELERRDGFTLPRTAHIPQP